MKHTKRKKAMKPSSYVLLSEFYEACHLLSHASSEQYRRISAAAEKKLDALALSDPEEATRIYLACPSYFDEMIEANEVYLGQSVFLDRDELKTLDTPEKRAAYIKEINGK